VQDAAEGRKLHICG